MEVSKTAWIDVATTIMETPLTMVALPIQILSMWIQKKRKKMSNWNKSKRIRVKKYLIKSKMSSMAKSQKYSSTKNKKNMKIIVMSMIECPRKSIL